MFVVVLDTLPTGRTTANRYGMRIVETYNALVLLVVERQAVVQPVGPLWRQVHSLHDELHAVLAVLVSEERLTIKVQQSIESMVSSVSHTSYYHQLIT